MANRRDYYYRQLVTEAELDAGFEGLEEADRALATDLGVVGVYYGLAVSQHAGSPNLSVDVSGPGAAYDQTGERCLVPSLQQVSVAVDSNNVSTTVAGGGNERYVSVFVVFDRSLADQRTDGNSNTVFFQRNESFRLVVAMGAEAASGTATRPSLLSSGILLADVRLVFGTTQVLNAAISTTRRQWAFVVSGAPQSLARGRAVDVFTDLLTYYNNHVTGVADKHPATAVNYAGGGNWADGTTNPAATVEAQLDKNISDLASTTSSSSGARKWGVEALAGTSGTIAAGTGFAALSALKLLANLEYAGGAAWLDGATNPAASGEAQLDKFVTDLTGQGSTSSGAHKMGLAARTAWLGGRTNPATTIFAGIDKIVTDFAVTTLGDDGAERVGFSGGGNLSSTDVHAALLELDSEKGGLGIANAWTGANTFTDISATAGTHYKFASAPTVVRVQPSIWQKSTGEFISPLSASFNTGGTTASFAVAEVGQAPIVVPHGATITTVSMRLIPQNHASIVGLQLPQLQLWKWTVSTGARTLVAQQSDLSGSAVVYSAAHPVSVAGLSEVTDRTDVFYYVQLTTENNLSGSNATFLNPPALTVTYTMPHLDDGY